MIVLVAGAQAQPLSNAGTEFWLGFPSNTADGIETLYITGYTATTGTVSIPGESFTQSFSVTPGTVTSVVLPGGSGMGAGISDGTEEKGIHVTAAQSVVVYGIDEVAASTDAYTGIPTNVIGTSYTVLASGPGEDSEFSVVASHDGTTVTITPSVDGGVGDTRPAGVPYAVTLNQGQEYQLRATSPPEDLTGTKITSSAPVSVYAGNRCAFVPNDLVGDCDYVVEQIPPEDTWGTSFLTEPFKSRSGEDDFELVADQNDTHVNLNGTLVATLNAGEHYSQEVAGASEFSSDKPILLAQYSNGFQYDNLTGDPSMVTIPPYQQFATGYTIWTPVNWEAFTSYVNLVVPDGAVGLVKIDGTAVPAYEFQPIGSSAFEGAQVDITPGSHVITGNGQPFGASVYGFIEYDAYGYLAGLSCEVMAGVPSPPHWYSNGELIPECEPERVRTSGTLTLTHVENEESEVTCTLTDEETIENPVGGGAGTDKLEQVAFSNCFIPSGAKFNVALCGADNPEVVAHQLPWLTHLIAGSPPRDEIQGIELEVKCDNGPFHETFTGTLMPAVGGSVLTFDAGSGALNQVGYVGTTPVVGTDNLIGPPGDEEIAATLPGPPTPVTGTASSITQTSATLNATVNPNGGTVSDCHFEYGTTTSYGSSEPCSSLPGAGTSPVAVSAPVTGLAANTTYHFRIVAANPGGTSNGSDETFATPPNYSPALPELGRCTKVAVKKTGEYASSKCEPGASKKTTGGEYDWTPGPGGMPGFKGSATKATLETVARSKVACRSGKDEGRWTGPKTAELSSIVFTGCESVTLKAKCQNTATAGEIRDYPLDAEVGFINKAAKVPTVGMQLTPTAADEGIFAKFECGGVEIFVTGSLDAPITVVDSMTTASTAKAKGKVGKQEPEHLEGQAKDTLETHIPLVEAVQQAAETVTVKNESEEELEIKAL